MIYILHGDDSGASYQRLTELLEKTEVSSKIKLEAKATVEQLYQHILGTSLVSEAKVIIVENYFSKTLKIPTELLEIVPEDQIIIFWEQKEVAKGKLSKVAKFARVELFRPKSRIFELLDNLGPGRIEPLLVLHALEGEQSLLWQLEYRFLLLLLAKKNLELEQVKKIVQRNIFDWQWQKILTQSARFTDANLLTIFTSTLTIDYLIKKGKTNLDEGTLISMMFLKYLVR